MEKQLEKYNKMLHTFSLKCFELVEHPDVDVIYHSFEKVDLELKSLNDCKVQYP